ncbi:unnamed protein product [Penicillium salamii]|uniref:Protein kinase domain-containing protein n=1 Tax=Penicillium salamii TaxID=1612424 RepID=A0A9W4JTR4_9EURO|nr:unnamed protein product [Penicillium salamii]
MVVRISCPDLKLAGDVVLKLFDRRFATQLREDDKVRPWTPEIERAYHQFVIDGGASHFIADLNNDDDIAQQSETWNSSQDEAYLYDTVSDLYQTEIEVYDALENMQGDDVPRLLAYVTIPGVKLTKTEPERRYIEVSGILLQYVEGFPLTDLADHTPREVWQSTCEKAIRILHRMSDHGILNEDVKTRSFIVRKDGSAEDGYKVFMIDFAVCNFRKDYADDVEWNEEKAIQDEEGAVGLFMQVRLKGGFVFRPSDRYKKSAQCVE